MFNLDATEEQLNFPTIYGSAKNNWMSDDWKTPTDNITYLLDKIIEYIPAPKFIEGAPQMLVTSLDYSSYVGRIAVGKVHRGTFTDGQDIMLCKRDGSMTKQEIKQLNTFSGLGKTPVQMSATSSRPLTGSMTRPCSMSRFMVCGAGCEGGEKRKKGWAGFFRSWSER